MEKGGRMNRETAGERNWQRVEQIAGVGFVGLIAAGCMYVLRPFVTAILWAAILCFATWPIYRRMETACRGRKNLAAALMTALIAIVMVLPFAIVGMTFGESVARLVRQINEYRQTGLPAPPEWVDRLPLVGDWVRTYWMNLSDNAENTASVVASWLDRGKGWLFRRGLAFGEGVFELALSVLIAFFFYRDGPTVVSRVSEGVKRIMGDYSHRIIETVGATVQSVVYGLLGTALAQGIMAGIGFHVAGIPTPFLWALLVFLFSLLLVGPPLVWVPATIWLFARGEVGWGLFMAVWGLFAISGIDNIVRPLLISRGTKLPFVITFLGVLGGILAFGFIGLFLGPTVLAAGYCLVQEFLRQRKGGDASSAAPPPAAPPP
jgi:predicted PurR-regulated permease PerM